MTHSPIAIIGAGPAGLTAAYELCRKGRHPTVFELSDQVGGLARTETYKGHRFDIGGHRFFSKSPEIEDLWRQVLGDEFLTVSRLSRIYYNRRFFVYPLSLFDVVWKLGFLESALVFGSFCNARLKPLKPEESFEDWVVNRFGRRLYRTFFKTYTEKVWGIPCSEIRADWAAQRIRGLSLTKALVDSVFRSGKAKTLIREFRYPRLGPGQMWERFRSEVEALGGEVRMRTPVWEIRRGGRRIESLLVGDGGEAVSVDQVLSSMPLNRLIEALQPPAPPEVAEAGRSLKYRDFLIVVLVIDRPSLFPDNWIYVHSEAVRVGRIQNFKNWSPEMVSNPSETTLGMEYFCSRGDDLWEMDDDRLIELARREIDDLGLLGGGRAEDGLVLRQPQAYPVYDRDYRRHLDVIRGFLEGIDNLQTIGRNGMHRYNNQDHSMLCGLYGARNLLGAHHDLWEINLERSYHEDYDLSRD